MKVMQKAESLLAHANDEAKLMEMRKKAAEDAEFEEEAPYEDL
ncbi:hypothetical protein A2U01_0007416 [Trifolium medium]|uniref:Uncharacterized protein n=1 Tax=Trifolium medium TaxID=97028 RepID=A0A392MIM0_9FABA|nr:hypothetical protein [Trifolium medium]